MPAPGKTPVGEGEEGEESEKPGFTNPFKNIDTTVELPRAMVDARSPANIKVQSKNRLFDLISELTPIKIATGDKEDMIIDMLTDLSKKVDQIAGNGEPLADILRHDQGHDDWHRSMGQEPCTSDEDCAAKTAEHMSMSHERHNPSSTWE